MRVVHAWSVWRASLSDEDASSCGAPMIWLYALTLVIAALVCFATSYIAADQNLRNPMKGMPMVGGWGIDTWAFAAGLFVAIVRRTDPIEVSVAAGFAMGGLSTLIITKSAVLADQVAKRRSLIEARAEADRAHREASTCRADDEDCDRSGGLCSRGLCLVHCACWCKCGKQAS